MHPSPNGRTGPIIGITASREEDVVRYVESIEDAGGVARLVLLNRDLDIEKTLDSINGLLLSGGADVDPRCYGQEPDPLAHVRCRPERDAAELPLIRRALERQMPILGICRGLQALNVAMGGSLIQDVGGHRASGPGPSLRHEVFLPPGARLTRILGLGGFMKVNSRHHQGLTVAQKAPGLMASAFSTMKDGIIEAVESPDYPWLIAVQWHPEIHEEVPAVFRKLFASFVGASLEGTRKT